MLRRYSWPRWRAIATTSGLLLAKGADPNRKMDLIGMFPSSPLFAAVGFGDPAVIQALLKGGANVHEKDNDGMTALHWAVVAHHPEAVKALLAAGADVNAVDHFGYTPLHYAATIDFGDSATATALLQAGADPNIKDKKGSDSPGGTPTNIPTSAPPWNTPARRIRASRRRHTRPWSDDRSTRKIVYLPLIAEGGMGRKSMPGASSDLAMNPNWL